MSEMTGWSRCSKLGDKQYRQNHWCCFLSCRIWSTGTSQVFTTEHSLSSVVTVNVFIHKKVKSCEEVSPDMFCFLFYLSKLSAELSSCYSGYCRLDNVVVDFWGCPPPPMNNFFPNIMWFFSIFSARNLNEVQTFLLNKVHHRWLI